MRSDFWVITSYFNPLGYRTRKDNFLAFRTALRKFNVPLIVVELAQAPGKHELGEGCADIYIPITHSAVFWHQESLLNIALTKIPATCSYVARIDCDLLFLSENWVDIAVETLQRFDVCYLFEWIVRCPFGVKQIADPMALPIGYGEAHRAYSYAALHARAPRLKSILPFAETGFALGFRKELIQKIGFFDCLPFGGADSLLAHSILFGTENLDALPVYRYASTALKEWMLSWVVNTRSACQSGISYTPGSLLHLYHGSLSDRHYVTRFTNSSYGSFVPDNQLQRAVNGLYEYKSERSALEREVNKHFGDRREDSAPLLSNSSLLGKLSTRFKLLLQGDSQLPPRSLTLVHELICKLPSLFSDARHRIVWIPSKKEAVYLPYKIFLQRIFEASHIAALTRGTNSLDLTRESPPTTIITYCAHWEKLIDLTCLITAQQTHNISMLCFIKSSSLSMCGSTSIEYSHHTFTLSKSLSVILFPDLNRRVDQNLAIKES